MKFITKSIHVGSEPNLKEGGYGDVVVPIHLATTFARKNVYKPTNGLEYSRTGNPTRHALEKSLTSLEQGKYAYTYASGLAAISNILMLLKSGDHILAIDDVYGGTRRLFNQVFKKFGLTSTFAPFYNGKQVKKLIQKNTKLIWIESPTNPLLKVVDIKSVAKEAKLFKILTVVDNTFATPYFQKPLVLGADIVTHSMTKYLGGHSDSVAGVNIVNSEKLAGQLQFLQNAVGAILSPFDSYQILKGIKTLALRMDKHQENAIKVVKFLEKHSKVKRIYYPGFAGVVSFELKTTLSKTIRFIESLKMVAVAESLGAVESLIEHPASMTHASIPKTDRQKIGLTDGLVRFSVGIEDVDDIIYDLNQALSKI